jgi:hypothetical protein
MPQRRHDKPAPDKGFAIQQIFAHFGVAPPPLDR